MQFPNYMTYFLYFEAVKIKNTLANIIYYEREGGSSLLNAKLAKNIIEVSWNYIAIMFFLYNFIII